MSRGSDQKTRSYRMTKRAEQVDRTRRRIVEATVALHGTLGPSATTVTAIAERAGVTRATVYRHFPDDAALYRACSTHWLAQQATPDTSSWARIGDPLQRLRGGLSDLYRFYRAGEPMLTRIQRDQAFLPAGLQRQRQTRDTALRNLLLAAFASPRRDRRALTAIVGHAIAYETWRSLCLDHGLTDAEAVEVMVSAASPWAGEQRQRASDDPCRA